MWAGFRAETPPVIRRIWMKVLGDSGVSELIKDVRLLAGQEIANDVKPLFDDESIKRMIQRGSDDLYYTIVDDGILFNAVKETFSGIKTPENRRDNAFYKLPEDFYKVLVLFYRAGGTGSYNLVPQAKVKDVIKGYKTDDYGTRFDRGYLVISRSDGDELTIVSSRNLQENDEYLLEYIPESPDVSSFRMPKGWSDYLLYYTASELSHANHLKMDIWMQRRMELKQNIIGYASNRSPYETTYVNRVQTDDETSETLDYLPYGAWWQT